MALCFATFILYGCFSTGIVLLQQLLFVLKSNALLQSFNRRRYGLSTSSFVPGFTEVVQLSYITSFTTHKGGRASADDAAAIKEGLNINTGFYLLQHYYTS